MKPLEYLRNRPVAQLALVQAMRAVLERHHGKLPMRPRKRRREVKQGELDLGGEA